MKRKKKTKMNILKKIALVIFSFSLVSSNNIALNKNKVNNFSETEKTLNVNQEKIVNFNKQEKTEKNEENELDSEIKKEMQEKI
jgi:precorrin-4 methylase